ncbi:MAG: hypothetical protein JO316_07425 [Abitibacteriaceae bacterium]|nr:hypothetical protein [Abditibacteriaceae bacterium]
MLIIVLIAAVCLYVGLYFAWASAQPYIGHSLSVLNILTEMLLQPRHGVFFILRGLILVTFCYVIADFFFSQARQGMKNSAKRKRAEDDKKRIASWQRQDSTPD